MPEKQKANVLIVPPDKSMAIIQDNENVCLFDSHSHNGKGGLIMTGKVRNLELFCWMVEDILKRDWNTSLTFSNLSTLKLNSCLKPEE